MLDSSFLDKAKGEGGGAGFRLHERPADWLPIQSRFYCSLSLSSSPQLTVSSFIS